MQAFSILRAAMFVFVSTEKHEFDWNEPIEIYSVNFSHTKSSIYYEHVVLLRSYSP